ncbi:MAG: DNA-directed DNA polymerase II small subunit [Methanosphaera sp.]|uniref:DNA-directed DNA polymerase II small subunit n=1 Tax=Methanosphaera sp. TaxID=2666342 RepID=UPI0025DA8600|nr:DNA-directed DNA polymerase II small subunit [Methanosphaera sp.]MCI5866709.1 DNA-directed DNA polymerase II small subunit [Methanosphaera sp.]MDD6534224.1 DNA-directed DNA polymerase II small subunit [Methanosphaera sp.]MDY3956392.1 DNA-directed DNA polymerase II small subunit [Methanosphaera sp.]
MLNDIIKKFQKADILVNYNAYSEIQGNDEYDYLIDELIEYVENNGDNEYIITTQTIRNYQMKERQRIHEEIKENPQTRKIRENQSMPYEILLDVTNKSYTDGDINDLNKYFNSRYEKLRKIIQQNPEFKSVNDLKTTKQAIDQLHAIGIVNSISNTKNGHVIIEIEDPTGDGSVIVLKDDEDLIAESKNLVKDEVIGITGSTNGNLIKADDIVHPGVQRFNTADDKEMDFSIAFISDVHIGSKQFDSNAFNRFIKWVNGNEGDEDLANSLRYLVIGGDLVDGIGIYPNQEKELEIKDIYGQYEEAARLLGDITDIPIILSPGNHDATRLAEPQPAITEKYAKDLCNQKNIEMVSNPSVVDLDGVKVVVYHGRSFDDMVMAMNLTHADTDEIMKLLVEKRHLAPIYGERTALASEFEDYMVLDEVPDVIHTGHVHINSYAKYKGIHLLNSGTFQKQTEFQKVYNIVPTCGQVPILSNGKMRVLDFSS